MKRKLLSTVLAVTMAVSRLTGCGQSGTNEATGAGAATTDAKTETYRVRIPIDSCDFSLAHYEADGEEADENFEHFSFERVEKYILPLLDAAEKAYVGKLDILLSITDSGREIAEMIYERHQILSSWLIQLGVNKQTAEEDACRIEHDISKESFNAIKQAISEQLNNRQK